MEKFWGDLSECIVLLLVFLVLLAGRRKKKPVLKEEVKEAPPVPRAASLPARRSEPAPSRREAAPSAQPAAVCAVRTKRQQMMVSYEILSSPVSLRGPR
jgi:hypothetical protein